MEQVALPRDEFAHPNSAHEWWYFSAFLTQTPGGRRFHYVACFMRWRAIWFSYMCWRPDGELERLHRAEHFGFVRPNAVDKLRLGDRGFGDRELDGRSTEEWGAELNRTGYSQHRVGPLALLSFRPRGTGAYLHTTREAGGIRSYGAGREMAWYSRPLLDVVGRRLDCPDHQAQLAGPGWFEHQWGNTDFRRLVWRYVPMLLEDGRRLIAFSFEHKRRGGLRVAEVGQLHDGCLVPLDGGRLDPFGPGGLTTRVTAVDTVLTVQSSDGRVDLGLPFVPRFFEGASRVQGTLLGDRVTGDGITEFHPA